uniref:Uncharacterized protein n=1 Tax=Anguilla anguilla TaxID=7936 RepID=A0A0E9SL80_ANGAN
MQTLLMMHIPPMIHLLRHIFLNCVLNTDSNFSSLAFTYLI